MNFRTTKRLLTIGHSYVVKGNRALAKEFHCQSEGRWEVTVIAPSYFHGKNDIRPLTFEADPNEPMCVEPLAGRLSRYVHFFHYSSELKQVVTRGFDLVHAWEEPYVTVGLQLALTVPKHVPLVYRTAQSLNKNYIPPFNWMEKFCVNRMNGWIFSGSLVEKNLLNRPGYAEKPRCQASLGFDPATIFVDRSLGSAIKRRFGWHDSTPVIGYMGRFVVDKGIAVAIESLRNLSERWKALFVGNGPMLGELQQLAADFPGQVGICTDVSHGEVVHYLNSMDVLIAPSLTMPNWREQFGRVIVEAFACGVPVIGSDSGEIPFLLRDTGIVVAENDSNALSIAIQTLLHDPELRCRFSQAGLDRAHHEFKWARIARKTIEFFDQFT